MKQIDVIKTYSQKRCLVVDDSAETRTSIKNFLVNYGIKEIDTSGNAEEAIELCRSKSYDIVLSDYNLGQGKDGQQLLEELRHEGLLLNTALYIIITSEMDKQYVLYALENQPDGYIYKPVNEQSLRVRLDAALMKNEHLKSVLDALDQRAPQKAISICETLLTQKNKFSTAIRKTYVDLLNENAGFEKTLSLLLNSPIEKRPLWVSLAIAKAQLGLEQFDNAFSTLKPLTDSNTFCLEALDLMAEIYEAQGKFDQAQMAIGKAINASSRSPARQRRMGEICEKTGDINAAAHAYRAAIKESKNSCQEQAQDSLKLGHVLGLLIKKHPDKTAKLADEAFKTLEQVAKKYAHHPIISMRQALIQAEIFVETNDDKNAIKATEKASHIIENMQSSVIANTPIALSIDCAKAFMAFGKSDEGERLLQEIAKMNTDPVIGVQIDKLLRDPKTKEGITYAASLNKKGIALYKENKIADAIDAFLNALADIPNHIGVNLNLLQTLLTRSKTTPLSPQEQELITTSFRRIGHIEAASDHYSRYQYLQKNLKQCVDSATELP